MSDYVIEKATIGHLEQREIAVVHMPRATFLELVDDVLTQWPQLRDRLRPIAETMPRYPMGQWIAPIRGCGCVVGEYIVATSELDRAELARRSGGGLLQIRDLLPENPDGRALIAFGYAINDALEGELLDDEGHFPAPFPAAIVIEDEMSV